MITIILLILFGLGFGTMWAQQKFKIFEKDADGHFQRVHYKPIVFVVLALVFVFLQPDSADLLLAHKQLQNKP